MVRAKGRNWGWFALSISFQVSQKQDLRVQTIPITSLSLRYRPQVLYIAGVEGADLALNVSVSCSPWMLLGSISWKWIYIIWIYPLGLGWDSLTKKVMSSLVGGYIIYPIYIYVYKVHRLTRPETFFGVNVCAFLWL